MKNHEKAKEFCEKEIYIDEGAREDLFDMIYTKITRAPGKYTLKGLMEDLGTTFAHSEPKEAIGVLEAIYDVLSEPKTQELIHDVVLLNSEWKDTNKEVLFDEAFNNMYTTAKQYHNEDLLKKLETYLEPLHTHEVPVTGEGCGDTGNDGGH